MQFTTKKILLLLTTVCIMASVQAQTYNDGIMMMKNNFCWGVVYQKSTWKDYWEGTFKRDNKNLGIVSTQMLGVMGNYGISNRLNVLFNLPYVKTSASAGQLSGLKGVQDLSLWLKWLPLQKEWGKGTFSTFVIGGVSLPASGYTADFLPLSIGLGSKTASLRGMVDYQLGDWFSTASATYYYRGNVNIDREAYYTTEMHYTDVVQMPDAAQVNVRAGFRSARLIAEAVFNSWKTLGGFDITKNNMPFPSNKMNMTTAGINLKYEFKKPRGLSFIGGSNYTLAGRNAGQSTAFYGGVFYVINFTKN